ncbi:MAG: hypothetical protein JJ992_01585, partial [Planctomycetes bacterium]|nr:hypothetical protein [Planctomycetota bacterium]
MPEVVEQARSDHNGVAGHNPQPVSDAATGTAGVGSLKTIADFVRKRLRLLRRWRKYGNPWAIPAYGES